MFNNNTHMEIYLKKANGGTFISWVSYDNCKSDICKHIGCVETNVGVIEILPGILMFFNQRDIKDLNFILPNGYNIYGTVAFLKRDGNSFAELNLSQIREIDSFLKKLSKF